MYEELVAQKNNLSHAYVCSGDIESSKNTIFDFLKNDLDFATVANPNLYTHITSAFGIDDSRKISSQSQKTAVGSHNRKIFIVGFSTITIEAQNALLKTLEEPSEGTIIFLLVQNHDKLLPTIMSRSQLLKGDVVESYVDLVGEFCLANFLEREKIYTQFLGDTKKSIPPNKAGAYQFIAEVLSVIVDKKPENMTELYRDIEQMQGYVTNRSSSLKYIFEYISLRLPVGL